MIRGIVGDEAYLEKIVSGVTSFEGVLDTHVRPCPVDEKWFG